MTDNKSTLDSSVDTPEFSRSYRRFALAMLTVVYAFNFIDRQILVILQESIKVEMGLSDAQLGILSGFAFALFYVSAGIPIARWADRSNRRNIVSLALAIWSGMTALSGLVQNYFQLVLARIGVGIGEAGGSPPAHSMISDYFPPQERATALSVYSMGIYFGILIGYLLGGWVNDAFGWRAAFFVVGIPGVLFAIVLRLAIAEPTRGRWETSSVAEQRPSIGDAFRLLWRLTSFRYLAVGCGLVSFVAYGNGNFMPSFLYRLHGMSFTEIGFALSMVQGIGGAAGTFLGGWLTDRMIRRDSRFYLWVPALGSLLAIPLAYVGYLQDNTTLALSSFFGSVIFGAMYLGPCLAVSHTLVPPAMRALTSAILFFILNLIGLGLGPLATGLISDMLVPSFGNESIRYAMLITQTMAIVGTVLFLIGGFRLRRDIQSTQPGPTNSNTDSAP